MLWSFIRFSQLIIQEMFGDQPEEFVCWYNWGLKRIVIDQGNKATIILLLQPIMSLRKNIYTNLFSEGLKQK